MPYTAQKRAYNRASRRGIDDISPLRECACGAFKAGIRARRPQIVNDTFARVPMRVRFSGNMGAPES